MDKLRIAIIAGVRFGIGEPHAGGLERHTDVLARRLCARGHEVTVFAGTDATPPSAGASYTVEALTSQPLILSEGARADVTMPPEQFMIEHDAYLDLSVRLQAERFDVVHNNSLHYLPVVSASATGTVHTLHTPPTPWLESAHRIRRKRPGSCAVVSVSRDNARRWHGVADRVIHNGVDLDQWAPRGERRDGAFWSGRLVPEKGPDLAIAAAQKAGISLTLAGPIHDIGFFERSIRPHLGDECVYAGHCDATTTAELLAGSSVALVTPRWDEPFGLVVAEALACGTPVAAFARGAIPELLGSAVGACAPADDVTGLAGAIQEAMRCDPDRCRSVAVERYSADLMARRYERTYRQLLDRPDGWRDAAEMASSA
jgi:glycosyltransferase involved in cell wall biosynthesis